MNFSIFLDFVHYTKKILSLMIFAVYQRQVLGTRDNRPTPSFYKSGNVNSVAHASSLKCF